jgi:hypothetical protein
VRALIVSVIAVAAVAAGTVVALRMASRAVGRSHVLVVPSRLGSFVRRPELEHQMNARQLRQQVITKSAGQASHVVSAVYENSAGASGPAPSQIMLFIGGNLTGVSPAGFMTSFLGQFRGARDTGAGSLGGRAACVNPKTGVAMCTWADGDTFGVVVSPTMRLAQLAAEMRAIRPAVERAAR